MLKEIRHVIVELRIQILCISKMNNFCWQIQVPQTCPNNGEVVGLECLTSESCQFLVKPGIPVYCIESVCCAYPCYSRSPPT